MNSWDKYYEAIETIWKEEGADEDEIIDENHNLDIGISLIFEDKLIELGYKEKIQDPDDDFPSIEIGEYSKDELLSIKHSVPWSWLSGRMKFDNVLLEKGLNSPDYRKAIELLGLEKEWIQYFGLNG